MKSSHRLALLAMASAMAISVQPSTSVVAQTNQPPTSLLSQIDPANPPPGYICIEKDNGTIVCIGSHVSENGAATDVSGLLSISTARFVPYQRLTTGPDGQTCVTTGYREVTDPTLGDAVFQ